MKKEKVDLLFTHEVAVELSNELNSLTFMAMYIRRGNSDDYQDEILSSEKEDLEWVTYEEISKGQLPIVATNKYSVTFLYEYLKKEEEAKGRPVIPILFVKKDVFCFTQRFYSQITWYRLVDSEYGLVNFLVQ